MGHNDRAARLAYLEAEATRALETGDTEAHMRWGRMYHAMADDVLPVIAARVTAEDVHSFQRDITRAGGRVVSSAPSMGGYIVHYRLPEEA